MPTSKAKKEPAVPTDQADEEMILAGTPAGYNRNYYRTAGIRMPGYGIVGGLQKFRGNFDLLSLRKKFQLSRWLFEANWFVGPVVALKAGVVLDGFRFIGEAAREWGGIDLATRTQSPQATYPWREIARDVIEEFLICDNVVALWRKNEEFPHVEIFDCESVDHACSHGQESITLKLAGMKSPDRLGVPGGSMVTLLSGKFGESFANLMVNGGERTVVQGEDEEFEFLTLTKGKRSGGLRAPSVLSIADDLDFIEMVKVGDWNGAYARRNIVLHMKKGTEVRTADPAAIKAGTARPGEIKAMRKRLDEMEGLSNLASNHDLSLAWLSFASDFFGDEGNIIFSARQRLMGWGGWAALLLMEGFSQVRGGRGDVSGILRAEVTGIRDQVGGFISRIFNHPDFLLPDETPFLGVEFADALLYTTEELMALVRTLTGSGLASFQTIREQYLNLNTREESRLLRESQDDKEGYTPPFEGRQGLLKEEPSATSGGGNDGRPPLDESPTEHGL